MKIDFDLLRIPACAGVIFFLCLRAPQGVNDEIARTGEVLNNSPLSRGVRGVMQRSLFYRGISRMTCERVHPVRWGLNRIREQDTMCPG